MRSQVTHDNLRNLADALWSCECIAGMKHQTLSVVVRVTAKNGLGFISEQND
jgi:hypothetical protein